MYVWLCVCVCVCVHVCVCVLCVCSGFVYAVDRLCDSSGETKSVYLIDTLPSSSQVTHALSG